MQHVTVWIALALTVKLVNSSDLQLCLENGICGRKCCPEDQFFNKTLQLCQVKASTPPSPFIHGDVENSTEISVCSGGRWQIDATGNPDCVEWVDEDEFKIMALVCDSTKSKFLAKRIILTMCCSNDEVYDQDRQKCVGLKGTDSKLWPPPVYYTEISQKINVTAEDFHLTQNPTNCPNGFVVRNSTNFLLNGDGTLNIHGVESKLKPGQFCLDTKLSEEVRSNEQFLVRFCELDPRADTNIYIRKCCPSGYANSMTTKKCEPFASSFSVEFCNESGYPFELPLNSYAITPGMKPNCNTKKILLDPEDGENFFILRDGNLFVPSFPRVKRIINEYCLDQFFYENYTVSCEFH